MLKKTTALEALARDELGVLSCVAEKMEGSVVFNWSDYECYEVERIYFNDASCRWLFVCSVDGVGDPQVFMSEELDVYDKEIEVMLKSIEDGG